MARTLAQLLRHAEEPARETLRAAAFAALNRCIDEGQKDPYSIANEADLAPLRADPRFSATLQRLAPAGEQKR